MPAQKDLCSKTELQLHCLDNQIDEQWNLPNRSIPYLSRSGHGQAFYLRLGALHVSQLQHIFEQRFGGSTTAPIELLFRPHKSRDLSAKFRENFDSRPRKTPSRPQQIFGESCQ